jgi:uncharacterized RDD family membrane protein YckC
MDSTARLAAHHASKHTASAPGTAPPAYPVAMREPLNPYSPPRTDPGAPPLPANTDAPWAGLPEASLSLRFVNMLIDSVGQTLLIVVLLVPLVLAGVDLRQDAAALPVILLAQTAYYALPEWAWGRTLAKLVTGTRVVTRTGRRPTFGQILGRTMLRFIPLEPLTFLRARGGLHDWESRTRVIRLPR